MAPIVKTFRVAWIPTGVAAERRPAPAERFLSLLRVGVRLCSPVTCLLIVHSCRPHCSKPFGKILFSITDPQTKQKYSIQLLKIRFLSRSMRVCFNSEKAVHYSKTGPLGDIAWYSGWHFQFVQGGLSKLNVRICAFTEFKRCQAGRRRHYFILPFFCYFGVHHRQATIFEKSDVILCNSGKIGSMYKKFGELKKIAKLIVCQLLPTLLAKRQIGGTKNWRIEKIAELIVCQLLKFWTKL